VSIEKCFKSYKNGKIEKVKVHHILQDNVSSEGCDKKHVIR